MVAFTQCEGRNHLGPTSIRCTFTVCVYHHGVLTRGADGKLRCPAHDIGYRHHAAYYVPEVQGASE